MNRWQQEREVEAEFLRMEKDGLARQVDGEWQLTEAGERLTHEELKEAFGIRAPIIRWYDKLRAWWLSAGRQGA